MAKVVKVKIAGGDGYDRGIVALNVTRAFENAQKMVGETKPAAGLSGFLGSKEPAFAVNHSETENEISVTVSSHNLDNIEAIFVNAAKELMEFSKGTQLQMYTGLGRSNLKIDSTSGEVKLTLDR